MPTHTHDLEITPTEVRKTFVRWDRGEADREWACLALLAEHARGIAPRPLRRETSGDGAPVITMERLPGEPLGGAPLTPEQTVSLGQVLCRLYAVPVAAVRDAGVDERRYGPTTHRQTVAEWLGDSYDLAECRDPELVAEAIHAALAWLARPGNLPEPRLVALGIADLNPANVLWDGRTCRLVDFEDGGLSDPAYELADHVEHLAARLPGLHDVEALVDAVGLTDADRERMRAYRRLWASFWQLTDADRERMRAYRRLWASFWLAMLLPGNGGFRRNPPGTTEAQATHVLGLLV